MRSAVAIVLAAASTAYAAGYGYTNTTTPSYEPPSYYTTTEVVKGYTTYCPEPTTYTATCDTGVKTYPVYEPKYTLTVDDCACTLTKTYTKPPHYKPTETPYVPAPPPPSHDYPAPEYPAPSKNVSKPSPPVYTGAGSKVTVAGGALGLIVAGAAYLL